MDWAEYKALCDQPNVWSSWMLAQCADLFMQLGEPSLAARLQDARQARSIQQPADFKLNPDLTMHPLNLSVAEREQGLTLMQRAAQLGLTTDATRQRGLGGFVEAWAEYARAGQ